MGRQLTAFLAGVLFAAGLAVGGMTNPSKVISFLDFFGGWDPSLAFVMGGAVLVYAPLYSFSRRLRRPLLEEKFFLPTKRDIDVRLVVGAALFGFGWGLGGFCPGPALVATASLASSALIFTSAMVTGMVAFAVWEGRRTPKQ